MIQTFTTIRTYDFNLLKIYSKQKKITQSSIIYGPTYYFSMTCTSTFFVDVVDQCL